MFSLGRAGYHAALQKRPTDMSASPTPPLRSALVVDDDDFSREVLTETLRSLGFEQIDIAENGRIALRKIEEEHLQPDFMVCDVFMPDMDGIEFMGELRRLRYPGRFILVSGVDVEMLAIAREMASVHQLHLLGSFIKPVSRNAIAHCLGLAG